MDVNETIETIMKRRSVRKYAAQPIPKEIVKVLIDAGNAAPSGCNAQNWRFVVVEDADFRNELAASALPKYKKWMENAPPAFVERRKEIDAVSRDPIYYDAPCLIFAIGSGMTSDFDTPMVCQNIMVAARSLGIGSCWVFFGMLPLADPKVRDKLEMKEGEKAYGPILLGYPQDGFPPPPPKNDPIVQWI